MSTAENELWNYINNNPAHPPKLEEVVDNTVEVVDNAPEVVEVTEAEHNVPKGTPVEQD